MDTPYSNRELDEKFIDIKDSLNRIEAQTMKTNGSVAKVTEDLADVAKDFNKWKYICIGFCSCVTVVLLPLIWSLIQNGKL